MFLIQAQNQSSTRAIIWGMLAFFGCFPLAQLQDAECPCVPGWICCQASGLCVPEASSCNAVGAPGHVASHLKFALQPQKTVLGASLPPIEVHATTDTNEVDVGFEQSVQLFLVSEHGLLPLNGQTEETASTGKVSFFAVRIAYPGVGYRLLARATGLPDELSAPFEIVADPSRTSRLAFLSQPTAINAQAPWMNRIQVEILDVFGQRVMYFNEPVRLSLGPYPSTAQFDPDPIIVNAVAGLAQIEGFSINTSHPMLHLVASSPGLFVAQSNPFAVRAPGRATKLEFTQTLQLRSGKPHYEPIEVRAVDDHGQIDRQFEGLIALKNGDPAPMGLENAEQNAREGTALFSFEDLGGPIQSYRLSAQAEGLQSAEATLEIIGRSRFVDQTNGEDGANNEINDCRGTTPCRSIGHAASVSLSNCGDAIFVQGSDSAYAESLHLNRDCPPSRPLLLSSVPKSNALPKLQADTLDSLITLEGTHIRLEGFAIFTPGPTAIRILAKPGGSITVAGSDISAASTAIVVSSGQVQIEQNIIHGSTEGIHITAGAMQVRITNNRLFDLASGAAIFGGSALIESNTFYQSGNRGPGSAITLSDCLSACVVRNNIFSSNLSLAIIREAGVLPEVTYNLFSPNTMAPCIRLGSACDASPGHNLVNTDPEFVDLAQLSLSPRSSNFWMNFMSAGSVVLVWRRKNRSGAALFSRRSLRPGAWACA